MKRNLTRVLKVSGGAALVLLAAGALGSAAAATLRSEVLVDSDTVRLGDVFQDAGTEADKIIASAPAPGRKLVLEATWLYRVARAYRVAWRPASRLDRAIVKRASNIIPASRIAAILSSELRRRLGENEKLDIEFDNRAMRIYLPASLPASVKVRTMDIDRQNSRFAAILVAPDNRPGAMRPRRSTVCYVAAFEKIGIGVCVMSATQASKSKKARAGRRNTPLPPELAVCGE